METEHNPETHQSLTSATIGEVEESIENLRERLAAAEDALRLAQLERWRIEAASREGLLPELATRLEGDTPEAIAADARRLAALLPVRKSARTGYGEASITPTRARQIFDRIEGRQDNPFEVLLQRRQGGGAFEE